jgi:hypothetical protein
MEAMEFDTQVKLAVYRHFSETGRAPGPEVVAARVGARVPDIVRSYQLLQDLRVLVLGEDGISIRMAPPFSGVVTQHAVESNGVIYHANCAWDALGIPAALQQKGIIRSACAQSGERLTLNVGESGPEASDWLFHCLVPAAHWWDDIVFT